MTAITVILILAAIYSGGAWLWLFMSFVHNRHTISAEAFELMERNTFHLGVCCILSLGFLGLILSNGGG